MTFAPFHMSKILFILLVVGGLMYRRAGVLTSLRQPPPVRLGSRTRRPRALARWGLNGRESYSEQKLLSIKCSLRWLIFPSSDSSLLLIPGVNTTPQLVGRLVVINGRRRAPPRRARRIPRRTTPHRAPPGRRISRHRGCTASSAAGFGLPTKGLTGARFGVSPPLATAAPHGTAAPMANCPPGVRAGRRRAPRGQYWSLLRMSPR